VCRFEASKANNKWLVCELLVQEMTRYHQKVLKLFVFPQVGRKW
jgi:hypothetical protein